ncbi:hypothetical protein N665_1471s0002 [Sinapis alba]|nr:hypothetical protein N665_1471s0002 [Sinapis alba]
MSQRKLIGKDESYKKKEDVAKTLQISVPKIDNSNLIHGYAKNLIEKCMNPSQQDMNGLLSMIIKIWKAEDRFFGVDLELGRFQFDFIQEEDIEEILNLHPYHFDYWVISLVSWEPVVDINYPLTITLWVRVLGVPLHFWAIPFFESIGKALGKTMSSMCHDQYHCHTQRDAYVDIREYKDSLKGKERVYEERCPKWRKVSKRDSRRDGDRRTRAYGDERRSSYRASQYESSRDARHILFILHINRNQVKGGQRISCRNNKHDALLRQNLESSCLEDRHSLSLSAELEDDGNLIQKAQRLNLEKLTDKEIEEILENGTKTECLVEVERKHGTQKKLFKQVTLAVGGATKKRMVQAMLSPRKKTIAR